MLGSLVPRLSPHVNKSNRKLGRAWERGYMLGEFCLIWYLTQIGQPNLNFCMMIMIYTSPTSADGTWRNTKVKPTINGFFLCTYNNNYLSCFIFVFLLCNCEHLFRRLQVNKSLFFTCTNTCICVILKLTTLNYCFSVNWFYKDQDWLKQAMYLFLPATKQARCSQ